jgi:hypothetical protein
VRWRLLLSGVIEGHVASDVWHEALMVDWGRRGVGVWTPCAADLSRSTSSHVRGLVRWGRREISWIIDISLMVFVKHLFERVLNVNQLLLDIAAITLILLLPRVTLPRFKN